MHAGVPKVDNGTTRSDIMKRQRHLSRAALAACILLAGGRMAQAAQTRAQDAATRHQSERTAQANRDAAVADEASTAPPARAATLNYGPVLHPRGQQGIDAVRKDPAEVRDETDTLARQSAPRQSSQPETQLTDEQRARQLQEQRRRAARRHQAWQGEGPMAPRPLRAGEAPPATATVPIPPPLPAPQPTVPSTTILRACQGIVCTDAAGNTFNGSGNAGVSSTGRVCTRNGATVQCF
jgi:hypothetical protein